MGLVELGRKEFDDYAINHKYRSFYQTSQYGTLMTKNGYEAKYVGLYDNEGKLNAATLILMKPLMFGSKFAYSPRGYLIDFNNYDLLFDFTSQLKDYLSKQKVLFLTIDPHVTHLARDKEGKPTNNGQNGVDISEVLKRMGYDHRGFNLYFENLKPRWNMVLKPEETINIKFDNFEIHHRTKIKISIAIGKGGKVKKVKNKIE